MDKICWIDDANRRKDLKKNVLEFCAMNAKL